MNNEYVETVTEGFAEIREALDAMDVRVDVATKAALKSLQSITKRSIKAKMRGRARWDHRGASQRTGPEVNLRLSPSHVNKGGGPGKFTGTLAASIVSSRKPRKEVGEGSWSGVVFSGSEGNLNVTKIYKGSTEAKYPYFVPGVKSMEPKFPAVWQKAWGIATKT